MAGAEIPHQSDLPIGLIGNDPVCEAIAQRLAAVGWRVIHLMLDPLARLQRSPLLEPAATRTDIALECRVILLAIEDTAVLRDVLLGDADRSGLVMDLTPGSVLVDLGMRPAREAQSILGLVGMRGVGVIDAALCGGSAAVCRGAARVLVGGYADAVDLALPMLSELGTIERTGPLGSAQTAAALMGYVEAAHWEAQTEAIGIGAALGLASQTLSQLFHDQPEAANIIRLEKQASFVRHLASDRGTTARVLRFRRLGPIEAS